MNIALIVAGGSGTRMGLDIPKQFIEVNGKPIIAYTMESFQKCKTVDAIEVVCLEGWEIKLEAFAHKYDITKLNGIAAGGDTCQSSIYNGLMNLSEKCRKDDIVIIHDGIRPMVSPEIIDDCIRVCQKYGSGVSALPVYEQVFRDTDGKKTDSYIRREELRILQTPQAYRFGKILELYQKSFGENIGVHPSAYANTLMSDMGESVYYSMGSTRNIKITTLDDIAIFKAMI